MSEGKIIRTIQKAPKTQIRCVLQEFKGREYIHIREYVEGEDGEYIPTKKGVAINTDLADELFDMMKALDLELKS